MAQKVSICLAIVNGGLCSLRELRSLLSLRPPTTLPKPKHTIYAIIKPKDKTFPIFYCYLSSYKI